MSFDSKEEIPSVCFSLDDRLGSIYEEMQSHEDHDESACLEEDRYIVKEKIAEGGLKQIHLAYDRKSARDVAMAFIRKDKEDKRSILAFTREAKLSALLEHPNIIPVYDVGENEQPFFTMKLVHGENLSHYLFSKPGSFSRNQLLRIFIKICDAVAYAHSRGMIHLDLKPGNIRIDNYGEVLIHDWGQSKRIFIPDGDTNVLNADEIEISDTVEGTPAFMAPEQFSGNSGLFDERTDVFSLGGILYAILTGEAPFKTGINPENRQLADPLKKGQDVPESLSAVSLKAMSKSPDDRYQKIEALQIEVERHLDGFATEAENAGFRRQLLLLIRRNRSVSLLVSCALLIIVTLISIFISRLKKSEADTRTALIKARQSQKETAAALKTANENFALYKNERDEREEISDITSTSLMRSNLVPDRTSYSIAMQQIKAALVASPGNKEVYRRKVILHIFYEEFEKALEDYKKSEKAPFLDNATKVIKKYVPLTRNGSLTTAQFVNLIKELSDADNKWIAGALMLSRTQKMKGIASHCHLMESVMEACNDQQQKWNWDYKTRDGVLFTHLSFKGHPEVYNFCGLAGRYISVLDLSNMKAFYPNDLALTHIKKLVLKGTKVFNIEKIKRIEGLEEIVINKGQLSSEILKKLDYIRITQE